MILYRSFVKKNNDISYSYTSSVNGIKEYGSCANLFNNQTNVGNNIIIGNNVRNVYRMFWKSDFNGNLTILNGITDCSNILFYANDFNKDITFPSSVLNLDNSLYEKNFGSNVFIKGQNWRNISVSMMFHINNSVRKNIYFNKALNNIFNRTNYLYSIIGDDIKWTSMTNGFYNASFNIYCYYNYSG